MEITFQELKDRILKLREDGAELILKHIDKIGLLLQIYEEVAYGTEMELIIDALLFDATKYELCCDGGGNTLSFLKELKVDNKIYYAYGLYECPGWYDETYDMSVVGHFVLSVEEKEVIGKPNNMTELATKVVSLLKETEFKTESSAEEYIKKYRDIIRNIIRHKEVGDIINYADIMIINDKCVELDNTQAESELELEVFKHEEYIDKAIELEGIKVIKVPAVKYYTRSSQIAIQIIEDFDVFGNKLTPPDPVLVEMYDVSDKFEEQFGYPLIIQEPYGVVKDVLELAKMSLETNTDLLAAYLDKMSEENINPSAVYGYEFIQYNGKSTGLNFTDEEFNTSKTCKKCGKQGLIIAEVQDSSGEDTIEYCPHCKDWNIIYYTHWQVDEDFVAHNTFSWTLVDNTPPEPLNNSFDDLFGTNDPLGSDSELPKFGLDNPFSELPKFGLDNPFSELPKFTDKSFTPTKIHNNKKNKGIKGLWDMFKR